MSDNSDYSDGVDDISSDNKSVNEVIRECNNVASDNESGNDCNNVVVPQGKKRRPRPETWKANVRKKLRNEGKAYYSKMANKHIEKRKNGPPVVINVLKR